MNSFKKEAWKEIITEYKGRDYNDALDIGTGPGFFPIIMAELGFKVTGIDCSKEMINEAESNINVSGYRANFLQADCHELPFEDDSFDFIICRNLVWTLVSPDRAYKEWYRVLRKGGRLVVIDANWFLRLSDDLSQKKYEQTQDLAREMGYLDKEITKNQEEECNNIAKKLPLTYEKRAEWDKKALMDIGFKNININEDITDKVYDNRQKALYSYAPLFLVSAEK